MTRLRIIIHLQIILTARPTLDKSIKTKEMAMEYLHILMGIKYILNGKTINPMATVFGLKMAWNTTASSKTVKGKDSECIKLMPMTFSKENLKMTDTTAMESISIKAVAFMKGTLRMADTTVLEF